jgi:hypothetical protein
MDCDRGIGPPWTTLWHRLVATSPPWTYGRSGAWKLTDEGQVRRGEDGEAGAALTWASEAVRWPGNDGKLAVVERLEGGDT